MPRQYNFRPPILVIGPSIAYVPLTKGYFSIIPSYAVDEVAKNAWHIHFSSQYQAYARSRVKGKLIYLHKLLFPEYGIVDHISGNRLLNIPSNTREATKETNAYNRLGNRNSRTGLKGVFTTTHGKPYRSSITAEGIDYHLGTFETKHEARAAYQEAALELHGDFARFD
jgi:hypothetical protein